jgi:restriction system protein
VAKDWDEYQEEAADFFRSLGLEATTNVTLKGVRTSHDIDVLVKSKHAGFEVTWVVECKHWNSKVTKLHVLALREIVAETGADRGILLAENGFQSGAAEAAALTNVHLTSLAEARILGREEVYSMRLAELHDRVEVCREKYWDIPKSVRIKYQLRAEYCEHSYSGTFVIAVAEELLRKAFRGAYPFTNDSMHAQMIPGCPTVVDSVESLVAFLEPQLAELELRLDRCLREWSTHASQ